MKTSSYLLLMLIAAPVSTSAAEAELTYGESHCKVVNLQKTAKKLLSWSGKCKEGYADGDGTLVWEVGSRRGSFEGTLQRGLAQGNGYIKTHYDVQFEGNFEAGKMHGRGVLQYANGTRYDGDFRFDEREGAGSISYSTGGRYDGQWKANAYHGRGKITYVGGQVLETDFVEGRPAGELANDTPGPVALYTFRSKDTRQGMGAKAAAITGSAIPYDKTYGQMTKAEQQAVRNRYPAMHKDDEPPFPARGLAPMYEWIVDAADRSEPTGVTYVEVLVDANGKATAVKAASSPDPAFTKAIAFILMKEKYKAGLCSGKPCPMIYLLAMEYQ